MLRSWKTFSTLALAALALSGCAKDQMKDPLARQQYLAAEQANAKDAPLAETPDILPQTYFAAGNLFVSQGQMGKAIEQYRKAIAVNHKFTAAYHRLGRTLSAAGEHIQAAEALVKAVELKPEIALLRNDYGYELMYLDRWAEAEEQFRKAIEIDPKFARAHVNLGLVLCRTERFEEALVAFQTVLPETDARYNLGLLYRGQKRYTEAAEEFRRVLELDPQFPAAQVQLDQLATHLESSAMRQREALAAVRTPDAAPDIPAPQPIEEPSNEPTASWMSPEEQVSSPALAEFTEDFMEEIVPMGPPVELRSGKVADATPIKLPADELAEEFAAELESGIRVFRHESFPPVVEKLVEVAADATAAAPAFAPDWLARELEAAYNDREGLEAAEIVTLEVLPARLVRDEEEALAASADEPTSVVEVVYHDDPVEYFEEAPSEYLEEEPVDWRADFRGLEALTGVIGNEIACLQAAHSPELMAVNSRETNAAGSSAAISEAASMFASPVQP